MRILFVGAEAAPIAKVGGMGDVIGALPKVLRQLGHDVRIFLPYYGFLAEKMDIPSEPIWSGFAMFQDFLVYETVLPDTDIPLYLFGHLAFSDAVSTEAKMRPGDLPYLPMVRRNSLGITGNRKLFTVMIGIRA